jgi:hypothetical protein
MDGAGLSKDGSSPLGLAKSNPLSYLAQRLPNVIQTFESESMDIY